MQDEDEDFLLTRSEVELRFGISKRFLEVANQKGFGPIEVRIGRSVRYRVKDIRSWLETSAVNPAINAGS